VAPPTVRNSSRCATAVAVRVFDPGTPGTDTSARLVTQVTLTDTVPPATKLDVSVVIWGAGQVSPAPARVLVTAEVAWVWASAPSAWTTAAWTPARAADSTSPWAESIRPRATMSTMTNRSTGAAMTSSAMAWPSSPRIRRPRSPTGSVLLDRCIAGGRHGEVEPRDEGLGPTGDRHLGGVA